MVRLEWTPRSSSRNPSSTRHDDRSPDGRRAWAMVAHHRTSAASPSGSFLRCSMTPAFYFRASAPVAVILPPRKTKRPATEPMLAPSIAPRAASEPIRATQITPTAGVGVIMGPDIEGLRRRGADVGTQNRVRGRREADVGTQNRVRGRREGDSGCQDRVSGGPRVRSWDPGSRPRPPWA